MLARDGSQPTSSQTFTRVASAKRSSSEGAGDGAAAAANTVVVTVAAAAFPTNGVAAWMGRQRLLQLPGVPASNVVLVGPNGVGKTMCASNLAFQAVLAGHTALFITAGALLGELATLDSDSALRRRLAHYTAPDLLVIDEVGYLSYSNRHADLLFELISRRYQRNSTVVTTNRAFAEWGEVFPAAACVVSLVDRLMHRAEVVRIEARSFRQKEAEERAARKSSERARPARARKAST